MLKDNFFIDRIERMYLDKEQIGALSKQDLLNKLNQFVRKNYGCFTSIEHSEKIQSHIQELDFILCFLFDYYDVLIKNLKGDYLRLGIILLIKNYIQDVIALRNMADTHLELQAYNIARTLMERELVIALCISDEEYRKELIINLNSKTDKQRFYNLTRPTIVLNKLKNTSPTIFTLFYSETWEDTYSLLSKFCHNDIYTWISYFDEGKKCNISLQNSLSQYFTYRLSYISQNIIIFFLALLSCYSDHALNITLKMSEILLKYWQSIIDDSYIS